MSSSNSRLHRTFGVDAAAHGDLSTTKLDPTINLEVICLGLPRTGTTSLQAALTILGFGPCHQGVDLFRNPARNEAFISLFQRLNAGTWHTGHPTLSARLRELMQGYRSTTDNPICVLGPETYSAYPDAKYILTTRPGGKEEWFSSLYAATGWFFRRDIWRYVFRSLTYSVGFLRRTDDRVQLTHAIWKRKFGGVSPEVYDGHNAEIIALISKEKLLIYDVRQGWEPLCRFLDVEVPDTPYPNLNDKEAMHVIFMGMMAYGAFMWLVYLGVAGAALYLAGRPSILSQGGTDALLDELQE
ncbi:hypothetical protein LTR22_022571 [Elasticomyces elasticus]|nr:hypothetical protein LTR22_022571 [Elasticomyces elasticus]KAK4907997.1 hypothetical protein LTR49_023028 [Elasticomyces elasticus]KAK5755251.1 hypothetical protein LTS12_014701 [Elasticomyces elasticus]